MQGRSLEDLELVDRAKRGDQDAYEELVRRYQELALQLAYVITGQAGDAEDAAQEAFVKAYYALPGFRVGASFRPWLLRIVANQARNRRKATDRHAGRASRAAEGRPDGDADPSPEAAALADEQRKTLLSALDRLPEEDRRVLGYRYFCDLSEAEMAEALGCARGTVKSRLSRALGRLRKGFTDLEGGTMGLEAALVALSAQLPHPPAADLAAAVRGRITSVEPSPGPGLSTALTAVLLSLLALAAGALALWPWARTQLTDRPPPPPTAASGVIVAVYWADRAEGERQQLADVFGADASRTETVTSEELVAALREAGLPVAPTDRAISSSLLTCLDTGSGLAVRTQHITRIPAAAYAAALLTAGVGDASVLIAGPASNPVSGETALVGVFKGLPHCQAGKQPEPDRVRLAYEQLAGMAALTGRSGDLNKASAVILKVAYATITGQARDEASIGAAVDAAAAGENLPVDAAQRSELVSLVKKLGQLDYGAYANGYRIEQPGPNEVHVVPTGAGQSRATRQTAHGVDHLRRGSTTTRGGSDAEVARSDEVRE